MTFASEDLQCIARPEGTRPTPQKVNQSPDTINKEGDHNYDLLLYFLLNLVKPNASIILGNECHNARHRTPLYPLL